jgi:hypothetical protein
MEKTDSFSWRYFCFASRSMKFSAIGEEWRRLKSTAAGRRFTERFHRKRSVGADRQRHRVLYIGAGSVVFVAGLVLKAIPFLPGGSAVIALGAGMVSRESRTAAQWLDKLELRLRNAWRRLWGKPLL